jgi:hypothetical protein
MAFRQTFRRLAAHGDRNDVLPHLVKWWRKHSHIDGQIIQHLSPHQQKIMSPMFKGLHIKTLKRAKRFICEAGPGLGLFYGIYVWAEWEHGNIAMHHRS